MRLLLQYLVFGITLAISIGPVNIELIKRGVTKGFIPSWLVGIGAMTADFVIIYIIYLGLGPFFTSNMVQIILGLIGAIMLIYMGVQNTRTNNNSKNEELDFETAAKAIDKKSFTTGFLLAIANPLNIVFWTGIYGALLTVETTNLNTPLLLIVSIFLGISISNITLAVMSAAGRSYVKPSNLRFISFSSGIILIGYGVWIGYSTMSSNLDVDLLALFA
jgi:threonine/homoserine/homoserine lactone efflux protein